MKSCIALLLAMAAPFAHAVCPNSCSGQGTCGQYDQCTCNPNFRGSDCSQRICPYAHAWVATPKGDLNFDGDTVDYTVYNVDVKIEYGTAQSTLITQEFLGGDWESWPAYAKGGEGHFYMECANRGLCDRESGTCQCFPGYEGYACNRMVCPNDCSGHGLCQSTSYLSKYPSTTVDSWYDAVAPSSTYQFWDGEMAMACACDPGYTGPDCSVRMCPVGDDILTQTDQMYETQFIDIYSKCEGEVTTGCPTTNTDATDVLGGSIKLTYTDHFGEKYTTEPIAGVLARGSVDGNGDDATLAFATNVKNALKALPNRVMGQSIDVKTTYCEQYDPIARVVGVDSIVADTHADLAAYATRDVGTDGDATTAMQVVINRGDKIAIGTGKGTADSGQTSRTSNIAYLKNPICVRLVVHFSGMPGDIANLEVDTSEVTYAGYTNAQHPNANIMSYVTDQLQITPTQTAGFMYTAPPSVTVTSSLVGTANDYVSGNKVKFDGETVQAATTNTFYPETKVEITCQSSTSGSTARTLGIYTIASYSATDKEFTLRETIPLSTTTQSDCGDNGGSNFGLITMTSRSHVVVVGVNDGTDDNSIDFTPILSEYRISALTHDLHFMGAFSGTAGFIKFASAMSAAHVVTRDSDVATTKHAIILLKSESMVSAGLNGADASVGTIAGSTDTAVAAGINAGSETLLEDPDGVDAHIYLDGKGTHESVECGARGLCDIEAGQCQCFEGYIGLACGTQAAISM